MTDRKPTNAHAMEKQAETMLSGMEGRIEHCPHLRKRIAQHLKETQHRAQRLDDAIGLLAGYTFEHYGIGSYRILVAAANALGETETLRILRENLREEEDMAQWLSSNIDPLTAEYLEREARGSQRAKR